MKRIFICSPYAGDVETNVAVAQVLCRMVMEAGHAPFAPHLLYPGIVYDSIPQERKMGIKCGLEFMKFCDEVWALLIRPSFSSGMAEEIDAARKLNILIRLFHCLEDFQAELKCLCGN